MKGDVLRSLAAVVVVIAVLSVPRSAALPDPSAGSAIPTALDPVHRIPVSGEWDDAALRSVASTVRGATPLPSQPPSKRDEPGDKAGATTLVGPGLTTTLTSKARAAASPTTIKGVAAWYADPRKAQGSIYAAAGPALRRALGPHWRGATVRICSLQRCITTRLGDYCVCRPSTIIDLSWRAFSDRRIGLGVPLWRGVVRVTVSRA